MADLLTEEARALLLEGTRTGKLAVLTPSGSPHVTPIWFVLDGDEIVFSTGRETVKGRYLRRDDRVSLLVDDERPPFAYVHIRGRARVDEHSDLLEWTTPCATWARTGPRPMGAETRCPPSCSSASARSG
jgi:hypothetical protein